MRAAADYAFLHSRVSTLAAQLLPVERLEPLIDDPDADHVDYFTAAGLTRLSDNVPQEARELEQYLAAVLLDEAIRLGRGLNSLARDLIHHFVRRFEMVNLKILIRCKLAGCSPEEIRARLFDLGSLPAGNLEQLLQAEDINEFLRLLEAGRHALLARQLRQVLAESQEVFLVEAAIDYGYFSALSRLAGALPFADRQSVHPFVARIIDQVNLVWLMRYRLGYGMTPPHAFFMLIRTSGQLDRARLAAIAQLDSLDSMIEALPPAISEVLEGAASVSEVEERFVVRRLAQAANVLHYSTFNLARALGYLVLREQQMRNIHEVLKGRVLQLSPELIRRAVGTPAGSAVV
jgi:V/A-type H+-transporting ATPase subunit C